MSKQLFGYCRNKHQFSFCKKTRKIMNLQKLHVNTLDVITSEPKLRLVFQTNGPACYFAKLHIIVLPKYDFSRTMTITQTKSKRRIPFRGNEKTFFVTNSIFRFIANPKTQIYQLQHLQHRSYLVMQVNDHMRRHRDPGFTCPTCGKFYTTQRNKSK